MALTIRQTRFVEEFLVCGCGAEAARRAGYSPRSAKQQASRLMLTNDDVSAAIEEKRAQTARISELRVAHVVEGLIDAVETAKVRADAKTQISAWREIAKLLNFYPETTKSSRKPRSDIDPSDLSTWTTEELLSLIR